MNRPARFLVAAFIDGPAKALNTALNLAFAPADVHRLTRENAALAHERDRLEALIDRLAGANADLAITVRGLVTLDDADEDDAEWYEPAALDPFVRQVEQAAANVIHPSLITPLCEEFGREIDTRIKDVVEEWSA